MPWVPKKDALRKYREMAHYTVAMLARRVGISERQIRKIESDDPPGTIFVSNLYALVSTLGCKKEDLATWVSPSGLRAARADSAPTTPPKRRRRKAEPERPETFDDMVAFERELRRQGDLDDRIATEDGEFILLGAERIAECLTNFGAYDGERFVAAGQIDQHKPLTFSMAKVLGVESGEGARFRLARLIAYDVPVHVTVFTASGEATRKMIELARENTYVTAVVRVLVARPRNKWKGFVNLEPDAEPLPFAFVVDDILAG